jgi:hypothetical protein
MKLQTNGVAVMAHIAKMTKGGLPGQSLLNRFDVGLEGDKGKH